MKLVRSLLVVVAVLLAARPAAASPITILVGDKDWFGAGAAGQTPGTTLGPWLGWPAEGLYNARTIDETDATNGAHLTDIYSALYYNYAANGEACNAATIPNDISNNPGCTPNGDKGTVIFPFSGTLQSGSITMLMGDFECTFWGQHGQMSANVNGVNLPFCFDNGFRATNEFTFSLDPAMIAAANLAGAVRLNLDHGSGYDANDLWFGTMDYFAFDYFELNADVTPVPEPATFILMILGVTLIALRSRRR